MNRTLVYKRRRMFLCFVVLPKNESYHYLIQITLKMMTRKRQITTQYECLDDIFLLMKYLFRKKNKCVREVDMFLTQWDVNIYTLYQKIKRPFFTGILNYDFELDILVFSKMFFLFFCCRKKEYFVRKSYLQVDLFIII